jgi:hypothetical protein
LSERAWAAVALRKYFFSPAFSTIGTPETFKRRKAVKSGEIHPPCSSGVPSCTYSQPQQPHQ